MNQVPGDWPAAPRRPRDKSIAVMRSVAMLAVAAIAGCASYDGSSLVAGKSTGADAVALMGQPAERLVREDGGTTLFYPRERQTYAVELDRNGVVRGVEQRLERINLRRLVAGTTTAREVRALFGPPRSVTKMERQERDVWEYRYRDYEEYRVIWVQFSYDGLVREVLDMRDWEYYEPDFPGFR